MFQLSQQIGVVCSREHCCVLPVSISNHRLVYCEVFCVWRHVNRVGVLIAHVNRIRYLIRNNDFPKVVDIFLVFGFAFFQKTKKNFFFALLVSIDHSHSISRHRPRKLSQKFNMCTLLRGCRLMLRRL